jgi:enoyl-CoA hydratase/carnithine racemase
MNTRMSMELGEMLARAQASSDVRVVIVTGAGDRAFSSGGDFKERSGLTLDGWQRQHRVFETMHRLMRAFPKPLIAAVNGLALGGGCEMAMTMDFIVAVKSASFGQPEVRRGIIPGVGGTQLLPRLLPRGLALELLMTGRAITAAEAQQAGLVNHVAEDRAAMLSICLSIASAIANASPAAVRQVKRAVRLGMGMPLEAALDIELACYEQAITHPDREEGVRAFVERREPGYASA